MRKSLLTLLVCTPLALMSIAPRACAQSTGGTVRDSWDRAPSSSTQPAVKGADQPAYRGEGQPTGQQRDDAGKVVRSVPGTNRPAANATPAQISPTSQEPAPWARQRSAQSAPWPFLPAHPQAKDYHAANIQVIDSLESLYCLSGNYIRSLRARNAAGLAGNDTGAGPRDFAYPQSGTVRAAVQRPSLDALHRELLDLLDQCIRPR